MIAIVFLAAVAFAGIAPTSASVAFLATGPSSTAHHRRRNFSSSSSSTAALARVDDGDTAGGDARFPLLEDRRRFGGQLLRRCGAAAALASLASSCPPAALAAAEADDGARMREGYRRLSYLLDNWDKLTEKCDGTKRDPFTGAPVCVKSPLIVSEYMGFKSMTDPLFRAEKAMRRLEARVPSAKEAEYLDLVERWVTTSEEAQGMAYTSSWAGPENPNGGDDKIAEFLDRSKSQVVDARGTLKEIIEILQL